MDQMKLDLQMISDCLSFGSLVLMLLLTRENLSILKNKQFAAILSWKNFECALSDSFLKGYFAFLFGDSFFQKILSMLFGVQVLGFVCLCLRFDLPLSLFWR